MISQQLARQLRDAGLEWVPAEGDRFWIPDRDLEEHVFSISEMVVEVRRIAQKRRIMFNGAVEWALDSIVQSEAIWLPSEAQLRDRLGKLFRSFSRMGDSFRCEIDLDGEAMRFDSDNPADAYGLALLHVLGDQDSMLRRMLESD